MSRSRIVRFPTRMSTRRVALAPLVVESAGFLFIAAIIWLDEWLDIPHMLFGAPATPFRWHEAVWESTLVLLFGTLVVLYTARLLLRYLNRFIVLCAWCHRARLDERWVSVEEFLKAHHAETSHGMCPECAVRFEAEHAGAA